MTTRYTMQATLGGALLAAAMAAQAMPVDGLSAEGTGPTSIRVQWNAAEGAASYDLYQNGELIATGLTTTGADVGNLQPRRGYDFFVVACDAARICGEPSVSVNPVTLAADAEPTEPTESALGTCPAATDGSAPRVSLEPLGDGTATLSWCRVEGAEGYNVFLDGNYADTVFGGFYSTRVDYDGSQAYQVAWYGDGQFPAKSAVATPGSDIDEPTDGVTVPSMSDDPTDRLAALDAGSQAESLVQVYFTRHAEKMTLLEEQADGSFVEVCGEVNCAEVLNAEGELRAELLADTFADAGITARLTHAFSSHKIRTRQTIEQIAADAGLGGDVDKNAGDGIQEFPISNADGSDATELNPEGTSASEQPTIDALLALPAGSVALVAGHSGTLYDIMSGLGLGDVCGADTLDTCNLTRYPARDDGKVANFGDIWKITLDNGTPTFEYRVNLQPQRLELNEIAE